VTQREEGRGGERRGGEKRRGERGGKVMGERKGRGGEGEGKKKGGRKGRGEEQEKREGRREENRLLECHLVQYVYVRPFPLNVSAWPHPSTVCSPSHDSSMHTRPHQPITPESNS